MDFYDCTFTISYHLTPLSILVLISHLLSSVKAVISSKQRSNRGDTTCIKTRLWVPLKSCLEVKDTLNQDESLTNWEVKEVPYINDELGRRSDWQNWRIHVLWCLRMKRWKLPSWDILAQYPSPEEPDRFQVSILQESGGAMKDYGAWKAPSQPSSLF